MGFISGFKGLIRRRAIPPLPSVTPMECCDVPFAFILCYENDYVKNESKSRHVA